MRFHLVSGRLVHLVALATFALALFASPVMVKSHKEGQGGTHLYEVGDLMEKLDADFVTLVKATLLASVQELVNETPYGTIEIHAKSIADTAKILPDAEEFKGDNSMLVLSRQLEGAALGLAKAAKSQDIAATAKALLTVHGACVRCHEEARF